MTSKENYKNISGLVQDFDFALLDIFCGVHAVIEHAGRAVHCMES